MASDRFVLNRPHLVGASDDTFRVDYNGGGWSNLTMTQGTYLLPMFLKRLEDQLQTVHADFAVTMTADFFVNISHPANTFEIDWQADTVGATLGFDADLAPVAQSFTATQIPRYCWLPGKVRADQDAWNPSHKERFAGRRAKSGLVSGLITGKKLYDTRIVIQMDYGYNLYWSKGRSAAEQLRCMDEFIEGSRTDYPASGNTALGGFYFWPDYTDLDTLATMTAGDASTFNYTSSPDEYVFCEFDPGWDGKIRPGMDVGHLQYNITIPVATAPIPPGGWISL